MNDHKDIIFLRSLKDKRLKHYVTRHRIPKLPSTPKSYSSYVELIRKYIVEDEDFIKLREFIEYKEMLIKTNKRKTCPYCLRKYKSIKEKSVDHLIAINLLRIKGSKQDPNEKTNLVVCCKRCNNKKAELLPLDFIWKQFSKQRYKELVK